MKQTIIILQVLLLFSLYSNARERTVEEIKNIAKSTLFSQTPKTKRVQTAKKDLSITQMENISIVTNGQNGFVIVSNDDENIPVVGYSFSKYDTTNLPDGFKWWLKAINTSLRDKKTKANVPAQFYSYVNPLIQTKWGQSTPYNSLCPREDGDKCLTGCVATSMAQILYYYRYPLQGVGTHSYQDYHFDYGNTVFQWGNMITDYKSTNYSVAQANAVSTLMYACSVSVDMNFGAAESGAPFINIISALKNNFGFDEGTFYGRDSYSGDWMSLIYNELSNYRPVFYSGYNDKGGHAFIIDGYDAEGNVHINWGWDGDLDGYFDINSLDPENDGGYNKNQMMIINFRTYNSHPNLTMTSFNTFGSGQVGEVQYIRVSVCNDGSDFNGSLYTFASEDPSSLGTLVNSTPVTINCGNTKTFPVVFTPESSGKYYFTLSADESGKDIVGTGFLSTSNLSGNIEFTDFEVKEICISNWDSNDDGELSYAEAANVSGIGDVFWANQKIEDLSVLKYFTGLTHLPTTAFSGCCNLKTISLPDGIEKIGDCVFWDCYNLQSVNIPATVQEIGSDCFRRCNALTSIDVDPANQHFTSIDGILYNKSITTLIALPPAKDIKQYTIPNTVTKIYDFAIVGNRFIEEVNITSSVTYIGGSAFYDCIALKSVFVPDNVKWIGCNTWSGCSSVSSAYIGKGVTYIKNNLFGGCTSLESIDVAEDNTYICSVDGMILSKDKKTLYQYPSGKKDETFQIPAYITKNFGNAFSGCKFLKKLIIPGHYAVDESDFTGMTSVEEVVMQEGILSIGISAFYGNENLQSVTIPSTTTMIEKNAFGSCHNLQFVWSNITNPFKLNEDAFKDWERDIYSTTTLVVPDGCKNLYKNTEGWNLFKRIKEASATDIVPQRIRTINLPFEGTLSLFISEEDKYMVDELTIKGKVDATDLRLIRDMAGNNYKGELTNGQLRKIDMSDVTFVSGSDYYIDTEWIALDIRHSTQGGTYRILTADYFPSLLFSGTKIEYVKIPTSVKYINDRAFTDCSKLSTIIFPDELLSIGSSAFLGCESLTSMTIPGTVQLGRYTFAYCSSLENIVLGEGIQSIPDNCFFQCSKLESVTLPNSLYRLGVQVFQGTGLKRVFIPQNVGDIREMTFTGCKGLEEIEVDNNNTSYFSKDGVLYSSGYQILVQYPVAKKESSYRVIDGTSSIGSGAFHSCLNIKSVIMPKTLKTIDGESFYGCVNLEEITIPIMVNRLWYGSFSGCYNLKRVVAKMLVPCEMSYESRAFDAFEEATLKTATLYVPHGKKEVYEAAEGWKDFKNIVEVESSAGEGTIHFADDYTKSYSVAYWDTDDDDEVSLDEAAAVTDLGNVFYNSKIGSFDELRYFTGLKEIAYHAFYGCNNLKSVILPSTITKINSWAFKDCALTSIQLPEGLVYLYDDAFENCDELTTVTIPKNVYAKENMIYCSHPFSDCNKLAEIKVDPENPYLESIDNVLYLKDHTGIMQYPGGKKGDSYTILKGVTGLAGGVFAGCEYLKSIVVPEGVTYFNGPVFQNSPNLESIEIPSTIKTFDGRHLIYGCTNLKKFISHIENPDYVKYDVFVADDGVFTSATLYVPKGTKEKYQSTAYWSNFKKIVEIGDYIIGDANGDGSVTITDAVAIVNYILGNKSENFNFDAADVNGDKAITITDAVGVVNIILSGEAGAPALETLQELEPEAVPE